MEHKRLTLFAGHYGSGKTELAVSLAMKLAGEENRSFSQLSLSQRGWDISEGMETFPGRTDCYMMIRLRQGSSADIPSPVLNALDEMGWTVER